MGIFIIDFDQVKIFLLKKNFINSKIYQVKL
jgi:hypothetical protein